MPDARPARWNIVSVAMPFVGFLAGFAVGAAGKGVLWNGHPLDGIFWGILVWNGFCLFGLVAAWIARSRTERYAGLVTAGCVLNAILPLILLCSGVKFLLDWVRYG